MRTNMPPQSKLGRPSKYGRPARAVTVTLPEDVLGRLSTIHTDVGLAIVNLVERSKSTPAPAIPPAEITSYGNHAVIAVTPARALRRLKGVQLVPIGNGRALIALDASHSVSALELQLRDALENGEVNGQEREILEGIADILRRARGARGQRLETRNIIVLSGKPQRFRL
jgi:hypothetical protein